MKKELINEAFRLQQLAGLAPINEVFEEEAAAPNGGKFESTPAYKEIDKLVRLLMDMEGSKTISREQYEAIMSPVAKAYMDNKIAYEKGGDVNEEITMSEGIDTNNICNIEFDGVDHSDAPDYSDAFIYSAEWCDTGEALTEDELDQLNDDVDFVHDALQDYLY